MCAHTVSVYVEHGASVAAGVKLSVLPVVLHVPAAAGISVGLGELFAGGADSVTFSGSVPSETVPFGTLTRRVGVSGGGGAEAPATPEPNRLPTLWWWASAAPPATATTTTAINSTAVGTVLLRPAAGCGLSAAT